MTRLPLLVLLPLAVWSAPLRAQEPAAEAGAAEEVSDFIRIDEDEQAARLQTAVTRYEMDPLTVDLIGAVHVADKQYYEALNKRFEDYEVVLFELIGGEKLVDGKFPQEGEDADLQMKFLRQMMDGMARYLKLSGQVEEIDYSPEHFVHADLTLEEFTRRQDESGESILSFAVAAAQNAENKGVAQPDMAKLLAALLSGNADGIKLEMIKTLGQGDDQIAALAGENVIIADRNAKCFGVLDKQIGAGKKKIGIFYGAAHFPDMEKRLRERGFRKSEQEWMTAWDVPKPEEKAAPEPDDEAEDKKAA